MKGIAGSISLFMQKAAMFSRESTGDTGTTRNLAVERMVRVCTSKGLGMSTITRAMTLYADFRERATNSSKPIMVCGTRNRDGLLGACVYRACEMDSCLSAPDERTIAKMFTTSVDCVMRGLQLLDICEPSIQSSNSCPPTEPIPEVSEPNSDDWLFSVD